MNKISILCLLALATSCQNPAKLSDSKRSISSEAYQAQIKSDKKRQAELDLPFRGFSSDKNLKTIAFGPAAADCWPSIEKNNPDLMILTSAPVKDLTKKAEYRSIREKVPFMCTPSQGVKTEFFKAWPYVKNIIPATQDGTYHAKIFGTKKNLIQIIMVDEFNSPQKWSWLESELKKPTALKILTAPVNEREKLLSLFRRTKSKNIILLPNDRGLSSVEKLDVKDLGVVYEVVSQSRQISSENEPTNYGLIRIDWVKRSVQVEVRGLADEKIKSLNLKF